MTSLRLRYKLVAAFLVTAFIGGAIGLVGIYGASSMMDDMREVGSVRLPSIAGLVLMVSGIHEVIEAQRALLIEELDVASRQAQYAVIEKARAKYKKGMDIYEPLPQTPEEERLWKEFLGLVKTVKADNDSFLEKSKALDQVRDRDDSRALAIQKEMVDLTVKKIMPANETLLGHLARISDINVEQGDKARDEAFANSDRVKLLLGVGSTLGVLLSVCLGFCLARSLSHPIEMTADYARRVAEGDLGKVLDVYRQDEIGVLAEAIRQMVASLKKELGYANGVRNGFTFPCAIVDPENRMAWINQEMIDLLEKGGRAAEYLGKISGEFFWRDASKRTISQQALEEKRQIRRETQYVTDRGNSRIIDVTSTPFRDMDGNILGTLAIWYDLTAIRTQEEKIRTQAEQISQAAADARSISQQVATASEELSAQVEQSSRGAVVQKDRIGETATAMDQMNATVLEVARNASQAAQRSEAAKQRAQEGAGVVQEAVGSISEAQARIQALKDNMTQLGKRAESIDQVVGVISDIADQTNLLALNAAIEAARAGEAGRGFAVVADEVRKLAEKTMTATREVGETVHGIQTDVAQNVGSVDGTVRSIARATELANRSGAALDEIVRLIDLAAAEVQSIAKASEEQSTASEQINRAIDEINQISTETAVAMEQSAQAVVNLSQQAIDINAIIEKMQQG